MVLGNNYFERYGSFVWGPVILSVLPAIPLFLTFAGEDIRLGLFIGAFPVVGTFLFFSGFADYRLRTFIRDTPTSTARSVALGPVEVKGTAEPYNDVLTSPFTEKDAVCYKYKVEEYRRQGKHSRWVTIDEQRRGVPFYVRDETGQILVDPDGAELSLPEDNVFHVDGGDTPPEPIQHFIEEQPGVDSEAHEFDAKIFTFHYGNDRRYTEWFVEPGKPVYVFGTALNRELDGRERLLINKNANTPLFVISDSPEKKVSRRFLTSALMKLGGGFLLLLVTAGLLYFILPRLLF